MKKIGKFIIYKNPKDWSIFDKVENLLRIIFGFDQEWEKGFFAETNAQAQKIDEDFSRSGLYNSGLHTQALGNLTVKRIWERNDEKRKRMMEGLNLLPGWIALLISIISLLISIFK